MIKHWKICLHVLYMYHICIAILVQYFEDYIARKVLRFIDASLYRYSPTSNLVMAPDSCMKLNMHASIHYIHLCELCHVKVLTLACEGVNSVM